MTDQERFAVAACAIIVATGDDNLRDLTPQQRVVALSGRDKAWKMLRATGIEPTQLLDLGLRLSEGPV